MLTRSIALALALSTAACNFNDTGHPNPPSPVDDTQAGAIRPRAGLPQGRIPDPPTARPGMSTQKKVVLLGGAAALYYLYKHHQGAVAAQGSESQYYLSKNGRVYYRDADHRAHWVTPPPEGIAVPEAEARQYKDLQGYDNQSTGRDLTEIAQKEGQDPQ